MITIQIQIQIQGLEELLGRVLTRLGMPTPEPDTIQTTPGSATYVPVSSEDLGELNSPEKKRGRGRPKKEETVAKEEETVAKEEAKEEPKTEEATEDLSDLSPSEAKPATPPEKPKSGKVSKEEAVRIGAGVMRSHGPAALKSILSTLGIERASALTDEQIPQFIKMCEMLE